LIVAHEEAETPKLRKNRLFARAAADFWRLTLSLRRCSTYCVVLSMTRRAARLLLT